jgi:hypothetical protein
VLLVPGTFLVLGTAAYSTAAFLGQNAIREIFGMEDAVRILEPVYRAPDASQPYTLVRLYNHLRDHWRLDLGLPLIPVVLVGSRTTLLDPFLHFLPFLFFASSGRPEQFFPVHYPPSAAFTIATLPALRSMYNTYYDLVWLPRERKWLKEIQPRAEEQNEDNAEAQEGGQHEHIHEVFEDGEGVLEIDVDFDLFNNWNNGGEADNNNAPENPPVPIARGPGPREDAAHPDLDAEAAPAADVPRERAPRRVQRDINYSLSSLADTILGALIFPTVAAAVGDMLKYALPKSWVNAPADGPPTGLLQHKWGRSIVGGCLFVGVKDAVMLYVRWKMAQNHRKRKILDWDRKKKRFVSR